MLMVLYCRCSYFCLFITIVGLKGAGVIVSDAYYDGTAVQSSTLVTLGDLGSANVVLAIVGLLIVAALWHFKVKGSILIGIVVSEWNYNITGALLKGAIDTLKKHGAKDENILVKTVPGSFELTFGANQLIEYSEVDAVIAIGCVVRGDTPHFDYVCMGATQGITQLNASGDVPVIYGLITTNTMEQAEDRAGGKLGNKGDECAITAIKMIDFAWSLQK